RQEQPDLVAFAHHHDQTGDASIVSVIFQDNPGTVKKYFASHGGDWPVVEDPDGRVALKYGVSGVPESFLIDPHGIVVKKLVGGVNADELDKLLEQLRAGARTS